MPVLLRAVWPSACVPMKLLDTRVGLLATVEQVVVSVALIPLRFIRRGAMVDGIAVKSDSTAGAEPVRPAGTTARADDVVIDLRQRSRARLATVKAGPVPVEQVTGAQRGRDG